MKLTYENMKNGYWNKNGVFRKGSNTYIKYNTCSVCGDPYLTNKYKPSKFCCYFCRNSRKNHSMFGKKHSEETKRKISRLGSKHSEETKRKMSNPNLTDEDRQDKRNYPEYREWRTTVFKRDNYTCQVCGDNIGGNLVAHHIESYRANPKLRTTLSNGATTCENCHNNFHHQYGYGNNTRKQFEEFKEKSKCQILQVQKKLHYNQVI